ncbi:hypothetical protein CC86DRAFT_123403 [Ophiobolus disseminans]|uniref:Uncharacterized protein n=1 Tax=Ophiobolus disseminans TaxID=1469910 RepID=A0A6A6ZG40_9PLEO|nr:hypothetical protein CC86DRAFT_123403 [Ophiobolus disseminans]
MMSLSFQLQKINQSFERIASWYHEFMHRTELCFRALNDRIIWLEERQEWKGPSDEQVERVLRKILAEKFSHDGTQEAPHNHNVMKEEDYFVEDRRDLGVPRPVAMDAASLVVDPEAVPSKAYAETFRMLEMQLDKFPNVDLRKASRQEAGDVKTHYEPNRPRGSDSV